MIPRRNRRTFLKTTLTGLAGAALGVRPTVQVAAAAAPKGKNLTDTIIDTHTHFYDPIRAAGVPWPPKDDKFLYRTVLPKDYLALPKPQQATGTVVVEASAWVEDNQWILDLAAQEPFIVGLVGNLPVGTDEFGALLKRFTANRLFRGIRAGGDRIRRGLNEASFLRDLKRLAENGLSLDVLGGPDLLPEIARLARAIPDLRLVIDHVANVKIDGKPAPDSWQRGMTSAAEHRNVYCKVSGLVEGTGRTDGAAPRDVEFYRPVLDTVWSAFGKDRLIYGSNWPVSERFASCATVQAIVSDYFSGKGKMAVENVFWNNAKAAYQWVGR